MKKMISLVSVAVFAAMFMAGCGGYDKCADANNKGAKICQDKKQFKNELNCQWEQSTKADKKDNDGICKDAEEKVTEASAKDKALCEAAKDRTDCDAASATLEGKDNFKCEYTPETEAGKKDQKCEAVSNK